MKKFLLVLAVLGVVFALGSALQTTQTALTEVRDDGGEDGASLAAILDIATAGDSASRPSDAWDLGSYGAVSSGNSVYFNFAVNADGATFKAACFAWGEENGPAQLVCTIDVTGGAQAVIKWPDSQLDVTRFWVDTATTVTDYWPKTVTVGGSGGANDLVTTLFFDGMGKRYYKWYVWDADGTTGTQASNVSIWGGYF